MEEVSPPSLYLSCCTYSMMCTDGVELNIVKLTLNEISRLLHPFNEYSILIKFQFFPFFVLLRELIQRNNAKLTWTLGMLSPCNENSLCLQILICHL